MAGFYSLVDMKNVKRLGKRGREETDEEECKRAHTVEEKKEFRRQVQKMLDAVFAIRYCGGSSAANSFVPPRGLTNEFEKYMTESGFGDKLGAIHILCNTVRCIYNKVLCSSAATTTALEQQRRSCIDELLASIANLCQ